MIQLRKIPVEGRRSSVACSAHDEIAVQRALASTACGTDGERLRAGHCGVPVEADTTSASCELFAARDGGVPVEGDSAGACLECSRPRASHVQVLAAGHSCVAIEGDGATGCAEGFCCSVTIIVLREVSIHVRAHGLPVASSPDGDRAVKGRRTTVASCANGEADAIGHGGGPIERHDAGAGREGPTARDHSVAVEGVRTARCSKGSGTRRGIKVAAA
mmetsp:Transcript_110209/g.355759  ORF Transcript_110209/g.355759 Transcript_110209/m.355759 type:complete len:218 (-) Transcript_110209:846-1499(-)